ncbi:MAG: hypothetical protein E7456_02650 [Ruminococcaceae bacterium]|nr:hypothetical protein [Oscillospiraceae bacterium]
MEPNETREEILEMEEYIETYELSEPATPVKRKKRLSAGGIVLIVLGVFLAVCVALFLGARAMVNGCLGDLGREDISFSEMEYVRPDENAIIAKLDGIIDSIESNTGTISEQLDSLQNFNSDYYDIYTMYVLALIKHSQDMTDEYFTEEVDFFGEFLPLYSQKTEELFVACAQSQYVDSFEEQYFGIGALEDYKDGTTMTDKSVELSQLTSEIVNEYLIEFADPTVEFHGEEVSLYELLANTDISYEDYYYALESYYSKYNEKFGEMYVTLVRSNMRIAQEMGYDSYEEYMYETYYRDYTPEEADEFLNDIKEYIVPLFKQLNADGWYESSYASFTVTEEDVMNAVRTAAVEMGDPISSVFDYMERNGLYDISMSDVKEQNSYTTYIYNYDAPFIFINPSGTDSDIMTLAHEFGHFTESYINYGYESGLDCDESASQAMEYLMLSYLDSTLTKAQMNQLYEKKLLDSVEVLITQSYYSEFESRVYSLNYADVNLENINAIAGELAQEYGLTIIEPWENYYSQSWFEVPHLFQSPFYVISYCTSCDAALQIFDTAEEDPEKGVEVYLDLIDWDWNMTFVENLQRAGLDSPFEDGSIQDRANIIEEYFY